MNAQEHKKDIKRYYKAWEHVRPKLFSRQWAFVHKNLSTGGPNKVSRMSKASYNKLQPCTAKLFWLNHVICGKSYLTETKYGTPCSFIKRPQLWNETSTDHGAWIGIIFEWKRMNRRETLKKTVSVSMRTILLSRYPANRIPGHECRGQSRKYIVRCYEYGPK